MHKNIRLYYLFMFVASLSFAAPVFLLFEKSAGLTFFELALLEAIFAVTIVFFEIPSGAFADKYGRKNSMIVSLVFATISYGFYSFGFSFFAFLIAQILGGIGVAFASGATDALLYDTLAEEKQASLFPSKAGRGLVFAWSGLGIAGLIGGWLAGFDLVYPIRASFVATVVALFGVFFFSEPKRRKAKSIAKVQIDSWKFIMKHKQLKYLIIYMWLVFAIPVSAIIVFYQNHSLDLGLPITLFGFVFLLRTGAGASGSYLASWVDKKIKTYNFLLYALIILAFIMFILAFGNLFWFLFGLFWFEFVAGIIIVLLPNEINKRVKSDKRATVLSFGSLGRQIVSAALLPIAGLIGTLYSFTQVSIIAGVLMLLFVFFVIKWRNVFK